MKTVIFALFAAASFAAPAFAGPATAGDNAAKAASTVVNGNVNQTATVNNQIALAAGNSAEAYAEQNTVYQGTAINGNVTQTARADNQIALAAGSNTYASARQNVIGAPLPRR